MNMKRITYAYLELGLLMINCSCTAIYEDDSPLGRNVPVSETFVENTRSFFDNQLIQSPDEYEIMYKTATNSIPLILPLIYQSDHSIFLMPVAFDSTLHVDCIYLIDYSDSIAEFDSNRDLYRIDTLKHYVDEENPYQVIVSRGDIQKTYKISGFQFREIRLINQNAYMYPVNNKIPEVIIRKSKRIKQAK